MLDAGLVLYIGLIFIAFWRWFMWWRHRKTNWIYMNYSCILYVLCLVLLCYAMVMFIHSALKDSGKASWSTLPGWFKPMMLGAPGAAVLVFVLCGTQTLQHVNEIRKDRAIGKHDRAVQIVLLPAVYGVMAMSSMARLYQLVTTHQGPLPHGHAQQSASSLVASLLASPNATVATTAREELFLSKSETCFWVGDLYEAWALYQFAKLTLELIQASVAKMTHSDDAAERDKASALQVAHSAVESIAWLGVMLFLIVCVLQAGWSIYLLTWTTLRSEADWAGYNTREAQFGAAGMVASAGAIYNVHVVESTFHSYLEGYRPLLKFITVKVIVSFAFFQKGIFSVLKAFKSTLPGTAQNLADKVPLLGDILSMSEVEFQLFYDSLMLYECVLICFLHWWGWSAYEDWYLDDSIRDEEDEKLLAEEEEERRPLLDDPSRSPTSV